MDRVHDTMWPQVPLDGVTELRVHGMGGTPAADMLDDPEPVQISGDRVAGVMRSLRPDPDRDWTLDAYSWGGLTGRSVVRTLWLLLLPFSLVNLAGWMTPDRNARIRPGLVRLVGLGLTGLYVLYAGEVGMDFGAYQCGGDPACTISGWWLIGGIGSPARRIAVGSLLPVLVTILLWVLGARSRRNYEQWNQSRPAGVGSSDEQVRKGLTAHTFWSGQAYADRLAGVHVGASFALVAALLGTATGELTGSVAATVVTVLAGIFLAGAVLVTLVSRLRARVSADAARWSGVGLLVLAWVTAFAAPSGSSAGPTGSAGVMPGILGVFDVVFGVLVVAVPAVFLSDLRGVRGHPERLRGALLSFSSTVLGVLLAAAVLSGTALFIGDRLGDLVPVRGWDGRRGVAGAVAIVFPRPFLALGAAMLLLPLVLAIGAVAGMVLTLRRFGPEATASDQRRELAWREIARPGREARDADLTGRVPVDAPSGRRGPLGRLRHWWQAQMSWRGRMVRSIWWPPMSLNAILAALYLALPSTAVVAVAYSLTWAVTALLGTGLYIDSAVTFWNGASVGVGVTILALLPVGFMLLLRRGLTHSNTRRLIAILWDILTFWPRSFHPLAPPSYAERAVPELQTRLERIWTADGYCLLLGHSQGSVLVAAAIAALSGDQRRAAAGPGIDDAGRSLPPDSVGRRLSVITYGSPLTRLYAQFFPAYFDARFFAHLRVRLDDEGTVRWRNYFATPIWWAMRSTPTTTLTAMACLI